MTFATILCDLRSLAASVHPVAAMDMELCVPEPIFRAIEAELRAGDKSLREQQGEAVELSFFGIRVVMQSICGND